MFTFTNNTGQIASDLHIVIEQPGLNTAHSIQLLTNPPGCQQPTITVNRTQDVDVEFMDDVVWNSACVDSGESATFSITCGTGCQPQIHCFNWTIFASPIGTQCFSIRPTATPSATATASPTPGPPTPTATPTPTPAPTPTPTPNTAGHDARLARIGGVPHNVRLSPGAAVASTSSIVVANQGTHSDTIGVYVDVIGGISGAFCTPNGRVLETTVTLAAGAKTTLSVPVSYSCANPAAANGLSYIWVAVADHGADDLASCPPGMLQSVACFDALANDDQDPTDNRATRNGPKIVAQ